MAESTSNQTFPYISSYSTVGLSLEKPTGGATIYQDEQVAASWITEQPRSVSSDRNRGRVVPCRKRRPSSSRLSEERTEEKVCRDDWESRSISPSRIRETQKQSLVKEYKVSDSTFIKRLLIPIDDSLLDDALNKKYSCVLKKVIKVIKPDEDKSENPVNNVVLFDIYARIKQGRTPAKSSQGGYNSEFGTSTALKKGSETVAQSKSKRSGELCRYPVKQGALINENDKIKREDKHNTPEFHTMCLWKVSKNHLMLFDPTNIKLTQYVKKNLEKAGSCEVELATFGRPHLADVKFYGPPDGLILAPTDGLQEGMKRDCIDIAVKIAFVLVEKEQAGCKEEGDFIEAVRKLSNRKGINKVFKGSANNGNCIRELQSSNQESRKKALGFFEEYSDLCKYVTINRIADFEKVKGLEKDIALLLSEGKEFLVAAKRVSLTQLPRLIDLFKSFKEFQLKNRDNLVFLPDLEIKPASRGTLDIDRFIPEKGLENRWTIIHLGVINGKGADYFKKNFQEICNKVKQSKAKQRKAKQLRIIKELVGYPDIYGQTALHWAADRASYEVAKLLYDKVKSDPEIVFHRMKERAQTALHFAAQRGDSEIVELLLSDSSVRKSELAGRAGSYGQTPLHCAASSGFFEVCKHLYEVMTSKQICHQMKDRLQTALHFAVHARSPNIVKLLISRQEVKEKLIGITDHRGRTALDEASFYKKQTTASGGPNYNKYCEIIQYLSQDTPRTPAKSSQGGCNSEFGTSTALKKGLKTLVQLESKQSRELCRYPEDTPAKSSQEGGGCNSEFGASTALKRAQTLTQSESKQSKGTYRHLGQGPLIKSAGEISVAITELENDLESVNKSKINDLKNTIKRSDFTEKQKGLFTGRLYELSQGL